MMHETMSGHMMGAPIAEMPSLLIVDALGVIIGIVSVILIYSTARKIGGRVQQGLLYMVWGLVAMVLSFGSSLYFIFKGVMDMNSMAIHSFIMVIGMILFIISARKFSGLLR